MYITGSMSMAAISLLMTVIVLILHHQSPDKAVPKWVRVIFLRGLARLMCMRKFTSPNAVEELPPKESDDNKEMHVDKEPNDRPKTNIPPEMLAFFMRSMQKEDEHSAQNKNSQDWHNVSSVVNRFFFLAAILMIVGTVAWVCNDLLECRLSRCYENDSYHSTLDPC